MPWLPVAATDQPRPAPNVLPLTLVFRIRTPKVHRSKSFKSPFRIPFGPFGPLDPRPMFSERAAEPEEHPSHRGARGGGGDVMVASLRQCELAAVDLAEPAVVALGGDLADDGSIHGMDNVAESGLMTIDRVVPRSRLRPRYGSGWQPG